MIEYGSLCLFVLNISRSIFPLINIIFIITNLFYLDQHTDIIKGTGKKYLFLLNIDANNKCAHYEVCESPLILYTFHTILERTEYMSWYRV